MSLAPGATIAAAKPLAALPPYSIVKPDASTAENTSCINREYSLMSSILASSVESSSMDIGFSAILLDSALTWWTFSRLVVSLLTLVIRDTISPPGPIIETMIPVGVTKLSESPTS